jgi:UDP-N-acetylglucosamine 2-epimerase (non-hydrolysing)
MDQEQTTAGLGRATAAPAPPPAGDVGQAFQPAAPGRQECLPHSGFELPGGAAGAPRTILTIFGTRPEVIKLAPVLAALEAAGPVFRTVNVATGQHTDLVRPFVRLFGLRIDDDLRLMQPGQTPNQLCARALAALDPVLAREKPDLVLVQGDTTTALAGALAAFHQRVPVGHVEAGLRSGDPLSPYPEEMNRRLITRLATCHFAATARNRDTLLAEGVPAANVFLTGNPVVDALHDILRRATVSDELAAALRATEGRKRLVLTTHRRESFGAVLAGNLRVLRDFVARHDDVALLFPVHPNPAVRGPALAILSGHQRVHLLDPLDYASFVGLMARAWLIVSDSGGVQEEAPSLGKPLLVLRKNTERPEAVEAGVARLAGDSAEAFQNMLEDEYLKQEAGRPAPKENPFGRGDSGRRIAAALARHLGVVTTG